MDITEDASPTNDRGGTAAEDPGMDLTCPVVTDGARTGLVLRVGRQGRGRGEFINPQGVCYSDTAGGLVLVADSNCACVQVTVELLVCVRKLMDNINE